MGKTKQPYLQRLERELARHSYAPNTVIAYRAWIADVANFYSTSTPETLSESKVREYLSVLIKRRKYAPQTINQAIHALQFYFNDICGKSFDILSVPRPRRERSIPDLLAPEEVLDILNNTTNAMHHLGFAIIYSAGLEVSEAIQLQERDVDFPRRGILVRGSRGRAKRSAILADYVAERLKNYLAGRDSTKWLFPGRDLRKHVDPSSFQRAFARAVKRAGITKAVTLRSLRYSHVKHLEHQGVPLRSVLRAIDIDNVGTTIALNFAAKQEFFEEFGAPGGFFPFADETSFRSVALEQTNYELS